MPRRNVAFLVALAIYAATRVTTTQHVASEPRPAVTSPVLSTDTTPVRGEDLVSAIGIATARLDPEQRRMFNAYMDTHGIHTNVEAQKAFAALSAVGLLRLEDRVLIQRSLLIDRALERLDESECAEMVRAGVRSIGLDRFAEVLGPDTAADFVSLGALAAFAEIEGTPERRVPSEREIRQSVRPVLASLSSRATSRLLNAVSNLRQASDADACWSGHTLYHSVTVLPVQQAGRLARTLAIPPTEAADERSPN